MKGVVGFLNNALEIALTVIFSLLVIDVLWQVLSRFIFGISSSFTEELARFLLIWLTILGAAYLNGQRGHLSMDFLLRKASEKTRIQRHMVIEFSMMIFCLFVLVIGGGNLVYTTFYLGQKSSVLGIPLSFVYSVVPLCGLIISCYSIHHIQELRNKEV